VFPGDASKRELLDLRGKNVEYAILMREVDTARSLYDGLLQQFREVSVAAEIDTNNVSIIDRAEVPGAPESPSLQRNLMIALMLGLLCAAGCIGLIEAMGEGRGEDGPASPGLPGFNPPAGGGLSGTWQWTGSLSPGRCLVSESSEILSRMI
jgi:hypothetical protein